MVKTYRDVWREFVLEEILKASSRQAFFEIESFVRFKETGKAP